MSTKTALISGAGSEKQSYESDMDIAAQVNVVLSTEKTYAMDRDSFSTDDYPTRKASVTRRKYVAS